MLRCIRKYWANIYLLRVSSNTNSFTIYQQLTIKTPKPFSLRGFGTFIPNFELILHQFLVLTLSKYLFDKYFIYIRVCKFYIHITDTNTCEIPITSLFPNTLKLLRKKPILFPSDCRDQCNDFNWKFRPNWNYHNFFYLWRYFNYLSFCINNGETCI